MAERLLTGALLLLFFPVLLLVALAIKIESPGGPVFYRQERVGRDRRRKSATDEERNTWEERRKMGGTGQPFMMWKFRTMIPNAEAKTGPVWAMENDPRITHVGRVLRYLRLDEVPQAFNVLQGHMRLIGPRPERPQFIEQLSTVLPEYRRRHVVSPGITGLAQVHREYDSNVDDVRTKLEYDLFYVDNRCMMLNLKILLKTVEVVFRGRGAH